MIAHSRHTIAEVSSLGRQSPEHQFGLEWEWESANAGDPP